MTKIIVTLGPATNTFDKISMIKNKGVDFVRINMSHSSLDDLKYFIGLAKKANIPFIIDTEGSQVRTGNLSVNIISYKENAKIQLHKEEIIGSAGKISLKPAQIIDQLEEGDVLYIDFDTLVMRVSNTKQIDQGYIEATVISSGNLGNNKGVVIDPRKEREFVLPTLTKKDISAINIGLEEKIDYVAASFIRSGEAVKEIRTISKNKMKIISKVECKDALENLDEIIQESDYLLIDRGDLSKEIPVEKIPFTQKIILNRANKANKGVYVATNLLESMISNRKPTRAEVHDIINTIVDGAYGLTLAAETAIGKYPLGCINMLNKIISHSNLVIDADSIRDKEDKFVKYLEKKDYLFDESVSSSLVLPHGGKLINRISNELPDVNYLDNLVKIQLNEYQRIDLEQIAIGTYSPLEGFMVENELDSVLNSLRLPSGEIWPIPIILDIDLEKSLDIREGDLIALTDNSNAVIGSMIVKQKYQYDKNKLIEQFYGHSDSQHPGVKIFNTLKPILIGGKISLFRAQIHEYDRYYLTPKQTRRLFEEKNWARVVGFHTRNVIHLAHEYIQNAAKAKAKCDGLFLHPVVGMKRSGDYNARYIIKSYEIMLERYYPENETLFGVFSTYSRYGGVKEALFTALCRKNYGCSHFIIGRDHTGVGGEGNRFDLDDITHQFPDLGIEIIHFNTVYHSKSQKSFKEWESSAPSNDKDDVLSISGTEARQLLKNQIKPPSWFMRPEISKMIIDSIKDGEEVFVK